MALEQTVAPTAEPVSLADVKRHLRVDHTGLDDTIQAYLDAAVRFVSEHCGVQLCTATYALYLDSWYQAEWEHSLGTYTYGSGCGVIWLPKPPAATVTSITYYDSTNASTTLSSASYVVDVKSIPGRITLASGYSWPTVYERPNAITVTYTAGYGGQSSVPETFKQAIRLLVAHWFENAEAVNVGNIVSEVPFSLKALLSLESTGLIL